MSFTTTDIGKECPFCHEGTLKRYSTGKIGCDKFCWKNKEADETGSYPAPKKDEATELLREIRDILKRQYGQEE